jgi:uncharacterized glyoxalase superfamily protein PhnB
MTTTSSPSHQVANPPTGLPRIVAHLIYDDVGGAVDWLSRAFGFHERTAARHTDGGRITRAQLEVGDSLITVGEPNVHGDSPRRGVSSMLYVYVDDVDGHYRHATAARASIVLELADRPWGDRNYQATDPEGHQWTFAQHLRDEDLTEQHLDGDHATAR